MAGERCKRLTAACGAKKSPAGEAGLFKVGDGGAPSWKTREGCARMVNRRLTNGAGSARLRQGYGAASCFE